ncbi:MAG: DUF362 domain-containing protein [candidate division NC10 bacterium]|nr:DUF362 domain-containing protein [candidate division NC10 bacterium]
MLTTGTGLLLPPLDPLWRGGGAEAEAIPDLAVATGAVPSRTTAAAIQALGGMRRFIQRGDVVVVKPNIGWDRSPEQAADTNPEVVATLVTLCLEAGAKRVKVFDHPVNDARRCYARSGIAEAARRVGAEVSYVDLSKFREMKIQGEALKSWPIYTEAVEADRLINVPIAKHHGLSRLTMGLKNWMGVIGGRRSLLHQEIDVALADLASFFKPHLVVLDAMRILVANGPQGGSPQDVRTTSTVVAGVDQVAIDSYGSTLFGLRGEDLGYLRHAHARGLGQLDYHRLRMKSIKA